MQDMNLWPSPEQPLSDQELLNVIRFHFSVSDQRRLAHLLGRIFQNVTEVRESVVHECVALALKTIAEVYGVSLRVLQSRSPIGMEARKAAAALLRDPNAFGIPLRWHMVGEALCPAEPFQHSSIIYHVEAFVPHLRYERAITLYQQRKDALYGTNTGATAS